MSRKPILVSFFTNDWNYPEYAELLKHDCINLNISYMIVEMPSAGGYLQNTCLKPKYILYCLETLKRPILWVDVDGSIVKEPEFFNDLPPDVDIAAKRMPPYRNRTWHVGTMWFNYNQKVLDFVRRWVELSKDWSDESALEELVHEQKDVNIIDIPQEYFYIRHNNSQLPSNTVIFHRISSSTSKREQLTNKQKVQHEYQI